MLVICARDKAKYFFGKDWTDGISLNGLRKFVFTRSYYWVKGDAKMGG
jgi:hypothetical protein